MLDKWSSLLHSRDCNGISKLSLIQLILPDKISWRLSFVKLFLYLGKWKGFLVKIENIKTPRRSQTRDQSRGGFHQTRGQCRGRQTLSWRMSLTTTTTTSPTLSLRSGSIKNKDNGTQAGPLWHQINIFSFHCSIHSLNVCRIILGPPSHQQPKILRKSLWPILPRYGSSTNQTPLSGIIQAQDSVCGPILQTYQPVSRFRELITKRKYSNGQQQRSTGGQDFKPEREIRAFWPIPDQGKDPTRFASQVPRGHWGTSLLLPTEILFLRTFLKQVQLLLLAFIRQQHPPSSERSLSDQKCF